jgi:hypothetical protein
VQLADAAQAHDRLARFVAQSAAARESSADGGVRAANEAMAQVLRESRSFVLEQAR